MAATATTAAAAAIGTSQPPPRSQRREARALARPGGRLGSQVEPGQVADLVADRATRLAELVFNGHESPLSMRVIAAIPLEVADLTVPSATPIDLATSSTGMSRQ